MEKETLNKLFVQFEQLDNPHELKEAAEWEEKANQKWRNDLVRWGSDSADRGEIEAASERHEYAKGYHAAISKVLSELKALSN